MIKHTMINILNELIQSFQNEGIVCAQSDAEWIVQDVLNISERSELYIQSHLTIKDVSIRKIRDHAALRMKGIPVQYIVGYADFLGYILRVNEHVLIPRPETEMMVNLVLDKFEKKRPTFNKTIRILDIGTGSGNIAIALALKMDCHITAIDLSKHALEVARENARNHQVSDRIDFQISDIFNDIPSGMTFDMIVSNPPYIPEEQIQALPIEIKEHEPYLALSGGLNGLNVIKKIAEKAFLFLVPNGSLYIEIGGSYQSLDASQLFQKHPEYQHPLIIHKDLAGEDRILEVHKRIR